MTLARVARESGHLGEQVGEAWSDSHIGAGAGVDTIEKDDAGVCVYAADDVHVEEGWIEAWGYQQTRV